MIEFLRGNLVVTDDERIVLDVSGVGYGIFAPPIVIEDFSRIEPGSEVTLVIHHYLQIEQSRATPVLMGFRTVEERAFYSALAGAIGPRSALKAMSAPISRIAQSIELSDHVFLKSLPGIGAQKARDLVARLQGKLSEFVSAEIEVAAVDAEAGRADFVSEAIDALVSLDHKRSDAVQMVNRALRQNPSLSSVEDLLREAYRWGRA